MHSTGATYYLVALALLILVPNSVLAMQKDKLSVFVLSDSVADNFFCAHNSVTFHLARLKSNPARIVVAFPAGNSGAVLQFSTPGQQKLQVQPQSAFPNPDSESAIFKISINSDRAFIDSVVLGSMREVRRFIQSGSLQYESEVVSQFKSAFEKLPQNEKNELLSLGVNPQFALESLHPHFRKSPQKSNTIELVRRAYLGEKVYKIEFTYPEGCRALGGHNLKIICAGLQQFDLTVTVTVPFKPLPPLDLHQILNSKAYSYFFKQGTTQIKEGKFNALIERAVEALKFLAYRQKLLAGSFQYLTYFGRDTLIAARLLLPVAAREFVEAAYQSVLDRLSPDGEVAHEEDIGNQAILTRMELFTKLVNSGKIEQAKSVISEFDQPVYDYKMIDDDFMLAPFVRDILVSWSKENQISDSELVEIIAGKQKERLVPLASNLEYVLRTADEHRKTKFGISIKPGYDVGNWRDSSIGLGSAIYPADVNVYLVPQALVAIGEILTNPVVKKVGFDQLCDLHGFHYILKVMKDPSWLDSLLRDWESISKQYIVTVPLPHLRKAVEKFVMSMPRHYRDYFYGLQLEPDCALGQFVGGLCFPPDLRFGLKFVSLGITKDGKRIQVINSDPAFGLLGEMMSPDELDLAVKPFLYPFPLGLFTQAGPIVANPVLLHHSSWNNFSNTQYHGSVIWGWVWGMLELGLQHQKRLAQNSGVATEDMLSMINKLQSKLRKLHNLLPALSTYELWSWQIKGGQLLPVAYGSESGHVTMSNAVQLWSTVWLAVLYSLNE